MTITMLGRFSVKLFHVRVVRAKELQPDTDQSIYKPIQLLENMEIFVNYAWNNLIRQRNKWTEIPPEPKKTPTQIVTEYCCWTVMHSSAKFLMTLFNSSNRIVLETHQVVRLKTFQRKVSWCGKSKRSTLIRFPKFLSDRNISCNILISSKFQIEAFLFN